MNFVTTRGRHRAPPSGQVGWRLGAGILTVATILVGLVNYILTLTVVHILSASDFSKFAAAQGLLLVLGTGSLAAIPWAVARYMATADESNVPAKAMHFGLIGSAIQAAVLAPIAFFVCWSIGGLLFGLVAFAAAGLISLMAGPAGFLQGERNLIAIAKMRLLETVIRITVTLILISLVARNESLALLGFPVGSIVAFVYALYISRRSFPLHKLDSQVATSLIRATISLGLIQLFLSMLAALDTVYVSSARVSASTAAAYQAAALLARIPLFTSSAVSVACYTPLVAAPDELSAGREIRVALRTYTWLTIPFIFTCLTVPDSLLHIVIPAKYSEAAPLLKILCFAGALVGAINVITTVHQARAHYRSCTWLLVAGVTAQAVGLLISGRTGSIYLFATTSLVICLGTLIVLMLKGSQWLAFPRVCMPQWREVTALTAGALALFAGPLTWMALMAALTITCVSVGLRDHAHSQGIQVATT